METNAARPLNMIDTTDALEAVTACQAMKNFLFALILIGLALCQTVFWMNHFGLISQEVRPTPQSADSNADSVRLQNQSETQKAGLIFLAATTEAVEPADPAAAIATEGKAIEQAIDEIVESANQTQPDAEILLEKETDLMPAEIPTEAASSEMLEPQTPDEEAGTATQEPVFEPLSLFRVSDRFAQGVVAVCNCVIIAAAILYCLSLLLCLKISLAARLGGINHITRAFFISLFLLVALVPWQTILPGVLVGAIWRPGALWCECWMRADSSIFWSVLLYLRFCGLPFIALWLLLWSQVRSGKWTRATLRRLGVLR
ncbi:MAG: hypothetical protein ACYSOF_08260 [Planctomycetota bacterium]|jgi:hypothetical protein